MGKQSREFRADNSFIIGRHLGVPEAEVDKLIRQYIESTRVDFPDRPDVFPPGL
ncbi:MAG: hypothetical protein KA419_09360 [Acidobacteria bacterium]|nr:hypothetical protein [Acidobacteriota bacterium]